MSKADFEESYQSIEAHESLKTLWFLRFTADVLCISALIYFFFEKQLIHDFSKAAVVVGLVLYFISEMYFIVRFFRKDEGAVVALHIYSFISLSNFPVGFVFSIIHYAKSRHLKWS